MDGQPDASDGTGDDPAPGPAAPGPDSSGLAGFGPGGVWESRRPSAALAVALEAAGRGAGASREERIGLVRAAAALESLAAAVKLAHLRDAIREDDDGLGDGYHGDLPDQWSKSLTHDVALALSMSPVSAQNLLQTAHDLGALLPAIGALLGDGTLTYSKARAVNDALELLSDPDKTAAEQLIAPAVAGKTHAQVEKIAAQAAVTVDPGLAERSREHAERNRARVTLRRERSGAATLSGCDLPPPQTLAAHAAICARAEVYRDCGSFPGVLADQLRAMAYLDLMNSVSAEARIAAGPPEVGLGAPNELAFPAGPGNPGPAPAGTCGGSDCPCKQCDGRCTPPADPDPDEHDDAGEDPHGGPDDQYPDDQGSDDGRPDDEDPDDGPDGGPDCGGPDCGGPDCGGSDCGGPVDQGPDGNGGCAPGDDDPGPPDPAGPPGSQPSPSPEPPWPASPWAAPPSAPAPPKLIDLTVPLATLLGPPRRPGDSHGFGILDPKLCRALAALAAASPHTTACLTVTGPDGHAIAHGCLRSGRRKAPLPGAPDPPLTALPARLNLTIPATRLEALLARAPAESPTGWALAPPASLARQDRPGDPAWLGTWTITVPSGLQYQVPLEPVPTHACDHRRESHAYQPNDALRHLVQIRDHQCTFPTCSRHAKDSDFEHAIPYDQGGRTCGCNAGARSRACHQVKQTPGWTVTQPKPGWHQWTTPSGRTYTQEPHRYPD